MIKPRLVLSDKDVLVLYHFFTGTIVQRFTRKYLGADDTHPNDRENMYKAINEITAAGEEIFEEERIARIQSDCLLV